MTWSAAQPEAALRVLRTAAGRRALQVALLLGGLLVIGLLCEERAYAESGVGVLPEGRAGQAVSGVHVPGAAGGRLDRAAGDVEEAASEGVADARVKPLSPSLPSLPPLSSSRSQSSEQPSHAGRPEPSKKPSHPALPKPPSHPPLPKPPSRPALPDLPALPKLPVPADLPAAPSLPGLPDPPALPALPDLPTLPGPQASPPLPSLPGLPALPAPPGSDTALPGAPARPTLPLPAPVTADPQPGGATTPVVDATGARRQAGTPDTAAHGNEPHAAPAGPMVPGIHTHHTGHTGHTSHSSDPGHLAQPGRPGPSTHAGPTAAGHPPGGRPGGVLGNRSLADGGSSRHGDAHAVTPGLRVPLTLVAGLVARTDRAGARDSHREIPLFPG
ncbi:hypothetical protein QFZ55_005137 [Streptomyces luteogriseus]|uniref:hypothetical protein n=1 Tax=Streptomyces luteogriseus TaxID=68233 RepID=UPI002787D678|nr:hypothetical protein [Streptomyces luteogriseus]MDQ0715685.1 hypothetical protein [Streptomyces luteogriseus]